MDQRLEPMWFRATATTDFPAPSYWNAFLKARPFLSFSCASGDGYFTAALLDDVGDPIVCGWAYTKEEAALNAWHKIPEEVRSMVTR